MAPRTKLQLHATGRLGMAASNSPRSVTLMEELLSQECPPGYEEENIKLNQMIERGDLPPHFDSDQMHKDLERQAKDAQAAHVRSYRVTKQPDWSSKYAAEFLEETLRRHGQALTEHLMHGRASPAPDPDGSDYLEDPGDVGFSPSSLSSGHLDQQNVLHSDGDAEAEGVALAYSTSPGSDEVPARSRTDPNTGVTGTSRGQLISSNQEIEEFLIRQLASVSTGTDQGPPEL